MANSRLSSQKRRAQLTEAATRLIVTEGVGALSTRRLARDLKLSSGAFFRHFKTLDEVLEAVVERMVLELSAAMPAAAASPLDQLTGFVQARSRAAGDRTGYLQLVVSDQFRLALPRRAALRLKRLVNQSRLFLLHSVMQGQRDGSVRRDLPAPDLALLVMGLTQMLALSKGLGLGQKHSTATETLHKLLVSGKQNAKRGAR